MARGWLTSSKGSRHRILCLLLVVGALAVHPSLAQTTSDSWNAVAPLPTGRADLAAATGSDGKIYAVGGENDVDFSYSFNAVEAYNPRTNTWSCSRGGASAGCTSTAIAPMPTGRHDLAAAPGPRGKIFAIGGGEVTGPALGTVEAYNPGTNTWSCSIDDASAGCSSTTIVPMPTPRFWMGAAIGTAGTIYALGGENGTDIFNAVEAYNTRANRWSCSRGDESPNCSSSTISPMPSARFGLAVATGADGNIYAIGGYGVPYPLRFANSVEIYDPTTNTWSCSIGDASSGCSSTTIAPMPTARTMVAAATGSDGKIYVIGGACVAQTGSCLSNEVEAYDPRINTWSCSVGDASSGCSSTTIAPMPTARFSLAAATDSKGKIYAIGGRGNSFQIRNAAEAYTPAASPTPVPTVSASPAPTRRPAATPSPTASAIPTPTPGVKAVPLVSPVPEVAGASTASFTVSFSSMKPGQGEVYFGSGPGCLGLVEVATQDLHPGTTQHVLVVRGNDLPGTVGNNGIIPGVTYWFEVVTVTSSGVEMDDNNGRCYSVTVLA